CATDTAERSTPRNRQFDVGFTAGCVSLSARTAKCRPSIPYQAIPLQGVRTMRSSMKRVCALLLMAMFSMHALTACNTVAGAGKDISKAGDKVEDKAEDCK